MVGIMSKQRPPTSPNEGVEFDPMADDDASRQGVCEPQSVPIGRPVADAEFARMKKDAETDHRPRNRAQEDAHGGKEGGGKK